MDSGGMPWARARAIGDHGEDLACAHLVTLGWQVLDRNWRCAAGELDVVAREGPLIVFCEVKTRRSVRYGAPVEAVGHDKARRLRRLAWAWLAAHDVSGSDFRIDVMGVLCAPGHTPELTHLQGVA